MRSLPSQPLNRTAGQGLRFAALFCTALPGSIIAGTNPLLPPEVAASETIAEAESDRYAQRPFLPDTQGTCMTVGNEATLFDLESPPRTNGNNRHQALARARSLVRRDQISPRVGLDCRGLDPPLDPFPRGPMAGIPIHADQFGYAETSCLPPLDTVLRSASTRGSAAPEL